MLARNGAGLNHRQGDDGEARKTFGTGERRWSSKPNNLKTQSAICAELVGDNLCIAAGIVTARGTSPVLLMCRKLLAMGYSPKLELDCYRNGILALTIASIGKAARLEVNTAGTGFIRHREARAASLVQKSAGVQGSEPVNRGPFGDGVAS